MRCGPELLDELAFPHRPPWHRMGLNRIEPGAWLPPVPDPGPVLAAKRRLLGWVPEQVIATAGVDGEVLDRVAAELEPHALATVERPDDGGGPRRFTAAVLALVDDVCVMVRSGPGYALVAGAVFFPSRWSLGAKLGGSMAAVHAPVPDDGADLVGRTERFMARIDAGVTWERTNWFVHDRPIRFAPRRPHRPHLPSPALPPRLWIRSERQTLRGIDDGLIVFTIRTRLAPVEVFAERPVAAAALRRHLDLMPDELVAEKVDPIHLDGLLRYLASV